MGPKTKSETDRPALFFVKLIATGLFSGYSPWASGTVGTLVGVAVYLIPGFEHPIVLSLSIVVGFFAGVITSAKLAKSEGNRLTKSAEYMKAKFQSNDHGNPDPSIIVIDEIVGMWIALLFLPKTIPAIVIAFFAFRAFDIFKPFPAAQTERLPNGWGIMLDDVIAGVYALVVTHIALFGLEKFFPSLMEFFR